MNNNNSINENVTVKVYKRRYVMLLLTCLVSGITTFQTYEYTSISNAVTEFYKKSNAEVTTTSTITNVAYVVLLIYGIHFLKKHGIAVSLVASAAFASLGACVKCFALKTDRFYVLVAGQAISAVGQIFSSSLPSVLAATWFKNDELATVIGSILASQTVAAALPFAVVIYFNDCNGFETIYSNLKSLSAVTAAVATLILIAVVLFMEERPPHPPSYAQKIREESDDTSPENIKNLLKSKSYVCILISYVLNDNVNTLLTIILNQLLMSVFPNDVQIVSIAGVIFNASGIIGSLAIPMLLDTHKKFKLISSLCLIWSAIFLVAFAASLSLRSHLLVYISMFAFGSIITGFAGIAPDIAVDITYPHSEATSIGMMFWTSSIPPIILAPLGSKMIDAVGVYYSLSVLVGLLLIATLLLFCSKWTLKRHNTENESRKLYDQLSNGNES